MNIITALPDDIQHMIWKKYNSEYIVRNIKKSKIFTKLKFKYCVVPQLMEFAVGNNVSKYINTYISNYPLNWFSIDALDYIFYEVINDFYENDIDIFDENFYIDSYFYNLDID